MDFRKKNIRLTDQETSSYLFSHKFNTNLYIDFSKKEIVLNGVSFIKDVISKLIIIFVCFVTISEFYSI